MKNLELFRTFAENMEKDIIKSTRLTPTSVTYGNYSTIWIMKRRMPET